MQKDDLFYGKIVIDESNNFHQGEVVLWLSYHK